MRLHEQRIIIQACPICTTLPSALRSRRGFHRAWIGNGHRAPIPWLFPPIGLFMLVLAASFHHLTVDDQTDRLSVSFGPVPLFRRSIKYADIISAEIGRTTVLDGWGIHMSLRGGWVWNLWGRDCVVLQHRKGILRVGTDDAGNLAAFLNQKIGTQHKL